MVVYAPRVGNQRQLGVANVSFKAGILVP